MSRPNAWIAVGLGYCVAYAALVPLLAVNANAYLLGGTMKWVRTKHGERIPPLRALEDFEITRSENPHKVAGTLYRDFPLAHDITFSCFTLDRARGRQPRLVDSFDQYRRSVDRARRLVRDI